MQQVLIARLELIQELLDVNNPNGLDVETIRASGPGEGVELGEGVTFEDCANEVQEIIDLIEKSKEEINTEFYLNKIKEIKLSVPAGFEGAKYWLINGFVGRRSSNKYTIGG